MMILKLLGMMINLNVYYSSYCNMACDYCCIPVEKNDANKNSEIRSKILTSEFQNIINSEQWKQEIQKRLAGAEGYDTSTIDIVTLGIWGLEPSINQDLWAQFIVPILNHYTNIKGIFVSTNGIIFNYHSWANPLLNYCIEHQRKIKLWIQFSIDGPEYSQTAINNLFNCCRQYQTNEYFRLKLSTKSTLNKTTLYQNIDKWYSYMAGLKNTCSRLAQPNCDISLIGNYPTFERPGEWTKEDGIQWARWHVPIRTDRICTCNAGLTSFTITCNNKLYNCQLCNEFKNVSELSEHYTFTGFTDLHPIMLAQNEIIEEDFHKLDNAISTMFCRAQHQIYNQKNPSINTIPFYARILGNGALSQEDDT